MPGGTNPEYDEVVAAAGDVIAAGAKLHLAGSNETDLWVIEVWSSAEQLAAWLETQAVGNAAQEAILPNPEVFEFDLHRLLSAN
jgi:quinol monooxygenase YgiN